MLKSKIGSVQEVILPDFPDDDNTVTTTVTKSRRVSFGTNFVKEFIVGSAVSAQCMSEYEEATPSSDSSNANSSQSVADNEMLERSTFVLHDSHKAHKSVSQSCEQDSVDNRPKPTKFSSTICFSADSPTADMEFTEGCLTLAKSILDKKNKEMTVIIQAKPKEAKDDQKLREDETKYYHDDDDTQFEMSMTRCLKPADLNEGKEREVRRFESEKTKIFNKFEDEMSITRCNKTFTHDESVSRWEESKENRMPLDMIIQHLDKDNSDLENDIFDSEKSFSSLLNANPFDFSNESEELNCDKSVDMSIDLQPNLCKDPQNSASPVIQPREIATCDREPSPVDITMNEDLKEQSREPSPLNLGVNENLKEQSREPSPVNLKVTENFKEPSKEPSLLNLKEMENLKEQSKELSLMDVEETDNLKEQSREPSPVNLKVTENFKEPSKEPSLLNLKEIENLKELSKELSLMDVEETDNLKEQSNEGNPTKEPSLTDMEVVESVKDQSMEQSNEGNLTKEPSLTDMNVVESLKDQSKEELNEGNLTKELSLTDMKEIENLKEPSLIDMNVVENLKEQSKEPSLIDMKVIENLKEQSEEPGCVWSLENFVNPQNNAAGVISFNCKLLESSTSIHFNLKISKEDNLCPCSVITNSNINLNKDKPWRIPEYQRVIEFGFRQLNKCYEELKQKVETIRHIPYFLDQINSLMVKMNSLLQQIYLILTLYPGSTLKNSVLSFRLFSFPIFFSCVVSIDLTNLFKLSRSSLHFAHDFGSLNENKIREIYRDCLKREKSLCEFVIQSTKYLVDLEKGSGYVSKRGHIGLLPPELKL